MCVFYTCDVAKHDGNICCVRAQSFFFYLFILFSAFVEFVLRFRVRNSYVYRDKLRQSWALGRLLLEVDLDDLAAFDPELANTLQRAPSDFIPVLEAAATETAVKEFTSGAGQTQQPVQILLKSSGNAFPIRALNSTHVGRLVMVPGIVISASRVQAKATHIAVVCKNPECRYAKEPLEIPCSTGFGGANIPKRCIEEERKNEKTFKCGSNPYLIVGDKSRYCDHQVFASCCQCLFLHFFFPFVCCSGAKAARESRNGSDRRNAAQRAADGGPIPGRQGLARHQSDRDWSVIKNRFGECCLF
jgi:hypothetical protein